MKLLALDGNSIVNRAFYGIKLLSNGSYVDIVYYILLLIPLFNTLGMTLIITNLNKLKNRNYHAGDVISNEVDLYEEE